jgi:integrase/recombinase XerD
MSRQRKAPPGCYWRGNTLWGRIKVRGRLVRWSLATDDPAIAKARRQAGKGRAIADVHGDARRTFEEAFTAWDVQLTRSVGPKTAKRYLCSLKQLAPWLDGRGLSDIDGRLVAEMIRERQRAGVTNATIKRDLGALSSIMNFAILQGWIETNPVLPKLTLVRERRDPIMLPSDRDIALVMQRAPGMVGAMITAALKTGAREDELAKAKRIGHLDHARKQLTVVGKRNKLRVIDLVPFDGYEFFTALPAYVGKPHLFWHDQGAPYTSFAPTFNKLMNRIEAWAQANGVEFRRFRFHHLRHRHAVDWLKSGRDIYTLQGRLGHTSVKTTEGYWVEALFREDPRRYLQPPYDQTQGPLPLRRSSGAQKETRRRSHR